MPCVARVMKAAVATGLCAAACMRAAETDYAHVSGTVTVWIVSPATTEEKARIAAKKLAMARTLPTTVQESTTGNFGQPSSNVGQTAGSYGTPSANVGRNASDTGQTASSYGQTAGSLGTAASDLGQTAGSYGQTASSYGISAGSYGQTASAYGDGLGDSNATRGDGTRDELPAPTRSASRSMLEGFGSSLPGMQVRLVDVSAEALRDSLLGTQGTPAFPDVIVGVLPAWWDTSGWGLAMLGSLRFLDVAKPELARQLGRLGRAVILRRATHPLEARAYVLSLREHDVCRECAALAQSDNLKVPVGVAVGAVNRVLHGAGLGTDADDAAAPFSGDLAQRMALMPLSDEALGGLEFQFDVLNAGANDRLAVVSVRAVMSSNAAFGAARAVVVLRKDSHGHWRVLHISPGVPPAQMGPAGQDLLTFTSVVPPEKIAHVVGISQAAPVDGDVRPARPELWWDNGGGADMQVVEWQRKADTAWTATHLLLVPDDNSRTKTQVTARFANAGGDYRWRVWSVGVGGVMMISPWRRLTILP